MELTFIFYGCIFGAVCGLIISIYNEIQKHKARHGKPHSPILNMGTERADALNKSDGLDDLDALVAMKAIHDALKDSKKKGDKPRDHWNDDSDDSLWDCYGDRH